MASGASPGAKVRSNDRRDRAQLDAVVQEQEVSAAPLREKVRSFWPTTSDSAAQTSGQLDVCAASADADDDAADGLTLFHRVECRRQLGERDVEADERPYPALRDETEDLRVQLLADSS